MFQGDIAGCNRVNKRLECLGLVKQRGDKFDPRSEQHIQEPEPGSAAKLVSSERLVHKYFINIGLMLLAHGACRAMKAPGGGAYVKSRAPGDAL